MSVLNEKSPVVITADAAEEKAAPNTNVLTITRPNPSRQASGTGIAVMSTIEDIDSTHSMSPPPSARHEKSMDHENPFYNPTRGESKQNFNVNHSSFDLEAQGLTPQKTECSGKSGLLMKKSRCDPAWPDRQELKQRKEAAKRERACCQMWAGMSKTKRGIITTVVVLLFLGAAIGIGLGVSKRVGGGAVTKQGTNTPLSNN